MTYLPKAKLPQPDVFMNTHPIYVHDDMNVLSMVGKNGVSRIDVSQPPDKLVWEVYKGNFGYN